MRRQSAAIAPHYSNQLLVTSNYVIFDPKCTCIQPLETSASSESPRDDVVLCCVRESVHL